MHRDEIAVVAMDCEYPDASSPAELWTNALEQRRSFRRIPPQRLAPEYFGTAEDADLISSPVAALLTGYSFDRLAQQVSGQTFRSTDMTQWLALDVVGRVVAKLDGVLGTVPKERVGVIVGNSMGGEFARANTLRLRWPYVARSLATALAAEGVGAAERERLVAATEATYKQSFAEPTSDTLAGGMANVIAGRICNVFDFGGGGYTVDGACSSSLLAVTTGATALVRGEMDIALVGGVDLSIDPYELVGFSRATALAPELMRVYDRRSQGFWPGEGSGFLALMRAEDAERAGVRPLAIISGWGVTSDGAGGTTRPEDEGHTRAIEQACARAGWEPASVDFYEGHGTGTAVGDATELRAIANARGDGARPAWISSVKANIGHTKAAAGIASMIKTIAALDSATIPPATACVDPLPILTDPRSALSITREPLPAPEDREIRAGVSSMGFGGINAHVALRSAGSRTPAPRRRRIDPQDVEVIAFGAVSFADLAVRARETARRLADRSMAEVHDFLVRSGGPGGGFVRGAVLVSGPMDTGAALERLAALADVATLESPTLIDSVGGVFLGVARPDPEIVLLFPGQAAPVRSSDGFAGRRFGGPRVEGLASPSFPGAGTAVAQPAIVRQSLRAARILERLRIAASSAVGHSIGEVAALAWAGALGDEEAITLAARRGAAMAEFCTEPGGMTDVQTDAATALTLAGDLPLTVAARNGRRRTVLAGPPEALDALEMRARGRSIGTTRLGVSNAFHSPLMAPAIAPFTAALAEIPFAALDRRVVSSVTGDDLAQDTDLVDLLARQVSAPVLFEAAVEQAARSADLVIEAGPGSVFGRLAEGVVGVPVVSTDIGSESARELLVVAAAAYVVGSDVDWSQLLPLRRASAVDPLRAHEYLVNPCESRVGAAAAAPVVAAEHPPVLDAPGPVRDAPVPLAPVLDAPVFEAPAIDAPVAQAPLLPRLAPVADAPLPAAAEAADPLRVVTEVIAEITELPGSAITPGSRLLADLGLNSLTAASIAATAARRLGVASALAPGEVVGASVAELADLLAGAAGAEVVQTVSGVRSWVEPFAARWTPSTPGASGDQGWTIQQSGRDATGPLAGALTSVFNGSRSAGRTAIVLSAPSEHTPAAAWAYLSALTRAAAARPSRLLVLHPGDGAGAVKSLQHEYPDIVAATLDVSALDGASASVVRDALTAARHRVESATGFVELRADAAGSLEESDLRWIGSDRPAPGRGRLAPGDVLVVTGGARGIGLACGLAAARSLGVVLAMIGRTNPDDPDIAAVLASARAEGLRAHYYRADVAEAAHLQHAMQRIESELGRVAGIVWASGVNTPTALDGLRRDEVERTVAAKCGALDLLPGMLTRAPSVIVGFGSIIHRIGLHGEAHYALANGWLESSLATLSAAWPEAGIGTIEWSAWSGDGMGSSLLVLDQLARAGVTPLSVEHGVEAFLDELRRFETGHRPPVVLASRFGTPPTLPDPSASLPVLRFLEQPLVHTAGLELVAEAELSWGTDPYLAEHTPDGTAVVPGVLLLEAMAQAVLGLTGERPTGFADVRFSRAVTVADGERRRLRVAALAGADGSVDIRIRTDETGFAVDHAGARVLVHGSTRDEATGAARPLGTVPRAAQDVPDEFYKDLLFHGPRFRHVTGFAGIHADVTTARIAAGGAPSWFSAYLPSRLILGDPGIRDAMIHASQASVPEARMLPTAIESIRIGPARDEGTEPTVLTTRQRSHRDGVLVVDLTRSTADGRLIESWQGLRLIAVGATPVPAAWSPSLVGPLLERGVEEATGSILTRVVVTTGADREARVETALERLLPDGVENEILDGSAPGLTRRVDGAPLLTAAGGRVSIAHAEGLSLVAHAPWAVGVDVTPLRSEAPTDVLAPALQQLAREIAAATGEPGRTSRSRAWAVEECRIKLGLERDAPATLASVGEDGNVVVVDLGSHLVVTRPVRLREREEHLFAVTVPTPSAADPAPLRASRLEVS